MSTEPTPAPKYEVTALHWLPTNPPRPCPDLLTDEDAVAYLRISASDTKRPLKTLVYYRASGRLRGVRIGRAIVYPRQELDRFVRAFWDEQHPRIDFPSGSDSPPAGPAIVAAGKLRDKPEKRSARKHEPGPPGKLRPHLSARTQGK